LPGLSALQPRASRTRLVVFREWMEAAAAMGGLSIGLLGRRIGQFLEILM
jgi:hypothetical protein